jgi:hypothetical protein
MCLLLHLDRRLPPMATGSKGEHGTQAYFIRVTAHLETGTFRRLLPRYRQPSDSQSIT